jgi:CRP-like cAMP-binding protein
MPGEGVQKPSGDQKAIPDAAFAVLREYLEARAAFSGGDFDVVRDAFLYQRLTSGEFLQRAGDTARHATFVATGYLRQYVIDPKGKEHIVQFALDQERRISAPRR